MGTSHLYTGNMDHQNPPATAPTGIPANSFPLDELLKLTLAPLREDTKQAAKDKADALPIWERVRVPDKSFSDLQWPQLIEQLAASALSREGQALARAIAPLQDRRAVLRRMHEVSEGQLLHESDERPPLRGFNDVRKAISHTLRGGWLVAEDLYAIGQNCDVASRVARFYQSRQEIAPHLHDLARRLDPCDTLRQTLNHAIEPGGTLSDKASPDLARLRRAVQNQHDRVRAYLERTLREQASAEVLQDDYYTIREDRYVLPVRRSSKGNMPGIIHGYSSSGQTAYIEPNDLIELNNQLRWSQIELQEEEERILRRLSEQVARHAPALTESADVLAYLDYINACAAIAWRLRCTMPDLDAEHLELKNARHPLLSLRFDERQGGKGQVTVPNDLLIEQSRQILVVSGPNTGGKTVLLKTFGLCALMARCGLPLPVDEGSKMPLFRAIFTDIGDEQSIERDLSTFSGHLTNINDFIDDCGASSLVLLDELFTGTDPLQGAALAVSLLEELTLRGARVVVTTHLESLKTLAFQKQTYANASMGFDLETLSPTYQVTYGLPGSSYALRIAERLGFPNVIIDRARRVLDGQEHQSVEEILSALEDKRRDMEAEQRRLAHERRLAEQSRQKFQSKYDKLITREKDMLHDQSRRLKKDLDRAQSLVREQIKTLRDEATKGTMTQSDLEKLRQSITPTQEVIERVDDFARPVEPGPKGMIQVPPAELNDGLEVYVHSFKRKGNLQGDQQNQKDVRVRLGNLKVTVPAEELYYPHESARRDHVRGAEQSSRRRTSIQENAPTIAQTEELLLPQNSLNTCDLRGMHVDNALEKLEMFLDSAYLTHQNSGLYVIHGHGTGVLKRAVRAELPNSSYVKSFRRGEHGEGGDGVTIVFLRVQA